MNWIQAVATLSSENHGFVLVTVLHVEGSSPREAGTKMVVTGDRIFDTVGGGNLEFQAIARSRELLNSGVKAIYQEKFILGRDLSQCCGGKVDLLFECLPSLNFKVVLFGAGHVGSCLAKILAELPCRTFWMDSREARINELLQQGVPGNIRLKLMKNPDLTVENCPADAFYLMLTHSHELDMQLVEAVLSRDDSRFCGLIGSRSKAGKFRNRLRRKGFSKSEIDRLICPVGLPITGGKCPMEVAVSIAAQIIQLNDSFSAQNADNGRVLYTV